MSAPGERAPHVGIVVLVYNRADVSTLCLESLARARTDVSFELFVLDNASRAEESAAVERTFAALQQAGRLRGTFVRSPVNLGFPGGNNEGFRHFVADDRCTHVCLLNSDVVVTDRWLDRLLARLDADGADGVGPVTNACGNEQTVPVDDLPAIGEAAIDRANELDRQRQRVFGRFATPTGFLGFFCCVLRIEVLLEIGMLDERFGRGAFEDDDYCLRMRARGFRLVVARDVFVLHWGTASFSQLPPRALGRHLRKGLRAFERKHGVPWQSRRFLPVKGVLDDLRWLARGRDGFGDGDGDGDGNGEADEADAIATTAADGAWRHLLAQQQTPWQQLRARWRHRLRLLREAPLLRPFAHALRLAWVLLRRRPIVVLGRWHPAAEPPSDGYFQRVHLVDRELIDRWRVYLRFEEPALARWWRPGVVPMTERSYELHCRPHNVLHAVVLAVVVLLAGRIWVHSVLRLADGPSRWLYRLARRRVFDVHGVVPEEFAFHGDAVNAARFDRLEAAAVRRATMLVVVSRSMERHLRDKHGPLRARVVCLPMLPRRRAAAGGPAADGRAGVVYCGGLHKWQRLDDMLAFVHRQRAHGPFTFLVTDPSAVLARWRELFGGEFPGSATTVPSGQVDARQRQAAFGLALREDSIVNRVACPTKLVEYLHNGVVPILDTPRIGDFDELALRFVGVHDELPAAAERDAMARSNARVLRHLQAEFGLAIDALRAHL